MAAPVIQKAYIQDINRPIEVRHGGGLMFTGDAKADRISVSLYDCQTPFSLSGSVTATCIRNDGATVVLTGGITGGNTAYAVLEQSCFVVPGPLAVTIRVSAGGVSTTVLKAVYTIDQTTTEEIVDPGHVVPDISDIVAEYERMQAASEAAEAAAENANEAAKMDAHDAYINSDMQVSGRTYQTLRPGSFELLQTGALLDVISGNAAQAHIVPNEYGWNVYRYDFGQTMMVRLIDVERSMQGVLLAAAEITNGNTTTYWSMDEQRKENFFLADAILMNVHSTSGPAANGICITSTAHRDFEDVIVCADHVGEFDNIIAFGDSIFAGDGLSAGQGVVAQFASMMGLPVTNYAVGGATLTTRQSTYKNLVQQVRDYRATIPEGTRPSGTPLYILDGGTNDPIVRSTSSFEGVCHWNINMGQYGTDDTLTVYGAIKTCINDLLGLGIQPWQIVVTTPIPKGIRANNAWGFAKWNAAQYVEAMNAVLTAVGYAMYEVGVAQMCNVINGYRSIFGNLDAPESRLLMMTDDTHPTQYGAKHYAERIFTLLGRATQREVASLKSAVGDNKKTTQSIGNMQLYLPEHNIDGYYLNANGTPVADNNSAYTGLIEVVAGEKYVFSANRNVGSSATTLRVHGYIDGTWNQQITTITVVKPAGITKQEFTIPSGINGVRISLYAKARLSDIVFTGENDGGRVTAYDTVARDKLEEAEYIFTRLLNARNLFDVSTATDDVVLDANIANTTYGEPVANNEFMTSDYIRVFSGQHYTGNYTNHIAYYDKNKALISIVNQQFTTTAPLNATYARIDVKKTEIDPQRVVFAVGDALPDEPVDGIDVELSDKIKVSHLPDYFKATVNLFNPATVRDGYYINHNTGVYTANTGFGASDFIPVKPNTAYSGNFTNHLVWFTLDRKRISGLNQTFTATSPATAAFAVIDYNKSTITADKIMFVEGSSLPADYVPHFVPVNRIPKTMLELDTSIWQGKNILFYGDSITALINGDTAKRWSTYVSAALNPSGIHGRGVGGQTFAWNETGFEVDANGNYVKRGEGTDNCLGCFCSWQRISSMIIDTMKDSIDLVVIMGGTNDLSGAEEVAGGEPIVWTTPNWSANNNADTQWAAATEYNGGDYDVSTLTGGILSTVMKIQTRCPNAKIVLASPLSRWSSSTHAPYARSSDGKTTRDVADVIKQAAEYMSVPFIDITTLCGINGWNYSQYIADGVHPNTSGDKMLAAAVISGLIAMWPKIV